MSGVHESGKGSSKSVQKVPLKGPTPPWSAVPSSRPCPPTWAAPTAGSDPSGACAPPGISRKLNQFEKKKLTLDVSNNS